MKYSFLMCVNKGHEFLADAIESVLIQTDMEFEFFIIANRCDDELWSYLLLIDDPRVRVHRTEIGQLSFNLNYGINLIRTGYVLRMDADDICMPDRLEKTKKYLKENSWPDVMGGQAILINSRGVEIGLVRPPETNEAIRAMLWRKMPIVHPTCALRVESILNLRGYLGGFMSEDYDLWLRASRNKAFVFKNIDIPLIKYRISEHQSRGSRLGYAEVAGSMLREALFGAGAKYYFGALLGVLKRFCFAKN